MSDHTGDEWEYVPARASSCTRGLIKADAWGPDGIVVAVIGSIPGSPEEEHANGKLLAAAPKMLKALKALEAEIVDCSTCGGTGKDKYESVDNCYACGGSGQELDGTKAIGLIRAALVGVEDNQ